MSTNKAQRSYFGRLRTRVNVHGQLSFDVEVAWSSIEDRWRASTIIVATALVHLSQCPIVQLLQRGAIDPTRKLP